MARVEFDQGCFACVHSTHVPGMLRHFYVMLTSGPLAMTLHRDENHGSFRVDPWVCGIERGRLSEPSKLAGWLEPKMS